jgi:hypothetical protein
VKVLVVMLAKDRRGMRQLLDGQKARPVNRAWRGDGVDDLLGEAYFSGGDGGEMVARALWIGHCL